VKIQRLVENIAIVLCLLFLFVPIGLILVSSFDGGHYR
jgi:ABC-type spermidine/putrescine transport system permease subunit II